MSSCRCIKEKWQRDLERQRMLAKKTAVLTDRVQLLYKKADGTYSFVAEGESYNGIFIEIITQN